ncbi:MAG TPA: GMP synthase (glutamine-hydrolyzing), partial [Pseudohongiella sp.]|nr:GMP synthase (glutamine-hydrolyzing) [Pseudohongiella sp.]
MSQQNIHSQKILILDFGSQYTQLIARRVRELGVYCEIWDNQVDQQEVLAFAPQGVIFSGGPETATKEGSPQIAKWFFDLGL